MNINDYKKYEPFWGKWYLSKELGRGAYGSVYEAETRDFGNMKSALKIVSIPSSPAEVDSYRAEHIGADEKSVSSYFYGIVEDFLKEIRIMSQLKGKSNIVSIEDYEVREHTDSIGWDIFIRMEILSSLGNYFSNRSITEKDVVKIGVDICRALEECEKKNIIHRDIKQSNIFVSDSGDYKLGDFGVARTLEKTSNGLSKKGTYTYMAPEVYQGEDDYDSSVDMYSLGIVMYKLLNNNFEPFRTELTLKDEEEALKKRMMGEQLPPPANASKEFSDIILKACSYNHKDRFSSSTAMRRALEKVVGINDEPPVPQPPVPIPPVPDTGDGPTRGMFDNVKEYEVAIYRNRTFDNTERGVDIYVDGELVATNITESYSLKLKEGTHIIAIKLSNTEKYRFYDKINTLFGAKQEVTKEVINSDSIECRVNRSTGGVEFINGDNVKQKNKIIALILAIIPYNIFGLYQFYMNGKKAGLRRLCTLNFFMFGWVVDVGMAIGNLVKKD